MFRKLVKSPYFKAGEVLTISGILIVIISAWLGRTHFDSVFDTINHTLTPVYIGVVLSFLLCPLYNKLVKWIYNAQKTENGFFFDDMGSMWFGTKVPEDRSKKVASEARAFKLAKAAASAVCFVLVFGVIAILGYVLLPQLIDSIVGVVNSFPERSAAFISWADEHLTKFPSLLDVIHNIANTGTPDAIEWLQTHILHTDFMGLAEMISSSLISIGRVIINIIIGVLIAIYLLNYKEILFGICRKITAATCSDRKAKSLSEFVAIINETFIGFIVGRLVDAAIIGVLTYFVMTILGMPETLLISAIVGITNVIPFFGPFIGAVPSTIILLLEDPMQALYFVIMIVVIQQIDGNIIGPRIVGNAIGLNSFWVLLAVLIGGGFFGFIGMALGVPVFAVIYRYLNKITSNKLRKKDKKTETVEYIDLDKYDIDVKDIY